MLGAVSATQCGTRIGTATEIPQKGYGCAVEAFGQGLSLERGLVKGIERGSTIHKLHLAAILSVGNEHAHRKSRV